MEFERKQVTDERYAVVTGANKGIGFEIVRKLAASDTTVVLTARNENRGMEAVTMLHNEGLTNVVFHQLDVSDKQSIECLAKYLKAQYGRLDILVNNAGANGGVLDEDALKTMNIDPADWLAGKVNLAQSPVITTYETAKECIDTNYYGLKNVTESLLPLLQLSTSSANIVNVSSLVGALRLIPNEQTRKVLDDIESLTEEKIDKILENFLRDLKEGKLEDNGWQSVLPAYSISKATQNAYTRLLAKKHPNICINSVHPGYVKTDINFHTGTITTEEGAKGPIMLALLPQGGPSGCYFDQIVMAEF